MPCLVLFSSHQNYIQNLVLFQDFTKSTFTTLPLFHAYGFSTLWIAVKDGTKLFLYNARLSADLLVAAIQASNPDKLSLVPYVIKLLSETEAGLCALERAKLVYSAGSAVPSEVGDKLVAGHNVRLMTLFGSTETGGLMSSGRDFANDKHWEYMRPTRAFRRFMRLENRGVDASGPFELIVGAGWPCLLETNRPDGSYATRDLFVPHPTIADAYKYVGRADDTLVHYNGEKTNPVPMELAIRASPYVAECLVFGAGRSQPGVLIVPSDEAVHTAKSKATCQEPIAHQISKLVWTAVEAANKEAPSHSQIIPELVKVLPANTQFASADKGSLIRAKVNKAFEREIDDVYTAYEAGTSNADDAPKLTLLSKDASVEVVAQIISEVTGRPASELHSELRHTDFIQLGIDSLQATRIRNLLQKRVEMASALPSNLIFDCPTVEELSGYLYKHTCTNANGKAVVERGEHDTILAMLEQYKGQIQRRNPQLSQGVAQGGIAKHTVVLTGSTGSLGAHLVHQLALISDVETIICLNRAKNNDDARKRTDESLLTRGLANLDHLASLTHTEILCLAADLVKPKLGLDAVSWKLVFNKATCVIDNAWPVNFNMSVQSFRPAIQGSVNLINLIAQSAATSTPRYIYSSSIAAVMGASALRVEEAYSEHATDASEMGYGRSKWIVEKVCQHAQHHVGSGFDAVIARIGQMVGDRQSGIWNETEAWSLMIKSAQTIGCFPKLSESIAWQPVDDAGFLIAHMVLPSRLEGVFHVMNPATCSSDQLVELLARPENLGDGFEVVESSEWVRRLSESDPDPKKNPTIKLLGHFQFRFGHTERHPGQDNRVFSTDRLRAVFERLGLKQELDSMLVPLDATLLHNIVAAWRRTGFLK